MKFENTKPIYLQILDLIFDLILKKSWVEEERIPAIRELAFDLEVNPNTVAKAYNECVDLGIIYIKRGIGYFLCKDSYSKILELKREEFIKNEIPKISRQISILNISINEFLSYLQNNQNK